MSGQRPPEWEDPDDGHSGAGLPGRPHPDDAHPDPDPSEVASFLASVRTPALPASFEARISAAIAAEAAARATTGPADAADPADALIAPAAGDAKGTDRSANPEELSPATAAGGRATSADRGPRPGSRASRRAGGSSGPGDSRPGGRRRRLRMPSAQAASWVVVCCLVLAGFGFVVAHGSGSSSSSVAASAAASSSASAPADGNAQPASGRESQSQPEHDSAGSSDRPGFLVRSSGVAYQPSTLASQVRGQLASAGVYGGHASTPANAPTAVTPADSASASAASSSPPGTPPSPALSGCVSRLTGGASPSLVDRASYDGIPAYIIAVPTRVWAVRLGCTATDTQLLAQVSLNG